MRRRLTRFMTVASVAALPFLALAQTPAEPAPAPAPAEPAKPAEPPKPKLFDWYGTLDANLQYTKASGATAGAASNVAGRAAISFDSSNFGIKGTWMASEYAGATYQCETSASADGVFASPISLCNRNSRIGLTGNWGTLWYGNWDTPFKASAYGTKADDPFNKTDVYGFNSILSSPGFNYRSGAFSTASNTNIIGFDIRAQNSVGYHSPRFYGVSLKLQYSVNEFMNANATQDPALYGAVLNWDYGPISIFGAYEQHHDGWGLVGINGATLAFGATVANSATTAGHTSDSAWRVGAGYQLDWPAGATTLSGVYEDLTYKQDKALAGMVKKYERAAWHVALKHRIGDHELRARYSMANDGSVTLVSGGGSTKDYGASELALGYAYWIGPSLNVYLHYAQITNKAQGQYTFTIGGASAVAGTTVKGADPMAVGLGFRYTF